MALHKDHNPLSFDGPACDACGLPARELRRLDNGDMEPWHVCRECLTQDAKSRSKMVRLQKVVRVRRHRDKRA